MKFWKIFKTALYLLAGIFILIFNVKTYGYIEYIVGSIIILYGLCIIIEGIIDKNYFKEPNKLTESLTNILIGVVLLFTGSNIDSLCSIWGVWSILREGKEMAHAIHHISEKKAGILDLIESIIIIGFSFMLILQPSEHHIQTHIIILGVELILEVLFPLFNNFINNLRAKDKTKYFN